jgi:hypothetical protein
VYAAPTPSGGPHAEQTASAVAAQAVGKNPGAHVRLVEHALHVELWR